MLNEFAISRMARPRCQWLMTALGAMLIISTVGHADPPKIEFNRDIRPILSENCYRCHGPDNRNRQGKLRLDMEASAKGEAESGKTAVVPGKSGESELVVRILTDDPELKMPPAESGKTLTPAQHALLKQWIDEGGTWQGHWSFLPIKHPEAPAVPQSVKSPIDAFVFDALNKHGLAPTAEADRVTLARRLHFDLVGLPPKPEVVDAFVRSNDPKAYEDLVDRLLESPHFGERMALIWLDLVRYADSVGYHGDQPISVSPFRDYVIRSFNENKRFDRFTVEQLAGDLLAEASSDQRIASGYNRLGMMSAEGGIQDREYRAKYAAERVRNVSGTWLGLTLGCSECHDHKFDPVTMKDFYGMEAFFADIDEKGYYPGAEWGQKTVVPTYDQQVELASVESSIAALRVKIDTPTPELAAAQAEWEATSRGTAEWVPLKPTLVQSKNGSTLTVLDDSSVLATGNAPASDTYTVTTPLPIANVTAIRLEVLPDDALPQKGPGRAGNGNFVLTEFAINYRRDPQGKAQPIVLDQPTATIEQTTLADGSPNGGWKIANTIDGDAKGAKWGWAILPEVSMPQHAVFETLLDVTGTKDSTLTFTLAQNAEEIAQHLVGRFRLSVTASPRPVRAFGADVPAAIRPILALPADKRNDEQKKQIAAYYRSIAPALAGDRKKLADFETKRNALVSQFTTTLVTVSIPPRPIRILSRGNWMDDSGAIVEPSVPAVLPQPSVSDRRLTRLDLARWITSPENPLTARVFVNRLWKTYFGAGLSRKLDDLGSQGDWPSHPELIDWLAAEFIQSGWDVKRTIKLILMSDAYRQTSIAPKDLAEKDPYNIWLARQGRFRMDAELVRDNALAVSGLLTLKIGGVSAKPYQPAGYWAFLNFPMREWENDKGADLYRRGLYTHWQRQYLHPSLLAFDAPSREECTADRVRSNTPLQSLVLLNDTTYVEAARVLAERAIKGGGSTDHDKLDWIFKQALSRPITPAEEAVLVALLTKHRAEYAKDGAAAEDVSKQGAWPAGSGMAKAEAAAWTSVTRAIMNLHAFVVRN